MAHTHITLSKGFTLIEMLIVLAIIGVVTGVVVTGQHSFERSVILTNTAYDIALSIREAQAYGFSGKSATNAPADDGNYAYGIDFKMIKPYTRSYTLFADNGGASFSCHKQLKISGSSIIPPDQKAGDCYFSQISGDTVVNNFAINNGITISSVCVSLGASTTCGSSGQFDISFTRPNSVYVRFNTHIGNTACIKVSRSGTSSRYILVRGYGSTIPYENGTVSVSNTPVSPYCG